MLINQIKNKESYEYCERYVNQFKKVANEISPIFCPRNGAPDFSLPCLKLNNKDVNIYLANPSSKIKEEFLVGDFVNFYIHPEMVSEVLKEDQYDLLDWKLNVWPTSSARTVNSIGKEFFIKLHFNKRLSKYIRRLTQSSVKHSIAISNELESSIVKGKIPSKFGYFPESIGICYNDIGMIVREKNPRPFILEKRYIVPLFSLYSEDTKVNDKSFFSQLVSMKKANPLEYFLNEILEPIFENMAFFINNHGILLECHGQNVLVEFDENLNVRRMIHRDFQSIYVDEEIRKSKGLSNTFEKHVMGKECEKEISYGLVYDQFLGEYVLSNFVKLLNKEFNISEEKIREEIKKLFSKHFNKELFPKNCFYLMKKGQFNDNETAVEKYCDMPRYR